MARRATTASAASGWQQGEGTALRFRSPDEGTTSFTDVVRGEVSFENATIEDFVLLRATGMPMFLLSNALDDATMGITHVVRGEDHVPGTPKYLLLRDALDLGRPDVFAHLPMLVNEGRKKLSKRKDSVSVADFAARGFLPSAMVNYLALLGWGPKDGVEIRPLDEIVELFRLEDVTPSPAFFDEKKLTHVNAEHIRALPVEQFLDRARPFLTDDESARLLEPIGGAGAGAGAAAGRGRAHDRLPARRAARGRRGLLVEGHGAGQARAGDARRDRGRPRGARRPGRRRRSAWPSRRRRSRSGWSTPRASRS